MRARLDEFGDAEVAVVLFTRQRNLRGYRSRFLAPLNAITDEDRAVYRLFGLPAGAGAGDAAEDTDQQGGDFVVGPDGRLAFAFRATGPDARPAVDELIAAVRAAPR